MVFQNLALPYHWDGGVMYCCTKEKAESTLWRPQEEKTAMAEHWINNYLKEKVYTQNIECGQTYKKMQYHN